MYQKQARYQEATLLYLRALAIFTRAHGPDDPSTVRVLNNLARLYFSQEREEAATCALSIYEQCLPSNHVRRADPLFTLALLTHRAGRFAEAEKFSSRALALLEVSLPDHPKLAAALHLHANFCRDQERNEEAALPYQRALTISEQQWGETHTETIKIRDDYHRLLKQQTNTEEP